jgi:uncharacterized Zn finger protein
VSRYSGGWPAYVPVARRRRNAAREVARLQRAGRAVTPVQVAGRAIATTIWGKAWCDNLEAYRDYESRLPRGRTYVRNGSVIDLQVAPREVRALVSGSEIYRVSIRIEAIGKMAWQSICADCAGRIESLIEVLQGRLSRGVMERLCRQNQGLFPKPSEIRFSCSCPDFASMCKHVAAVLYGIGARLDEQPELLFRLRAVDGGDLVAVIDASLPASAAPPAGGRVLKDSDAAALFGLEIAGSETDEVRSAGKAADILPPAPTAKPPRPTRNPAAPGRKPSQGRSPEGRSPGAKAATKRTPKAPATTASRTAAPRALSAKAPGATSPESMDGARPRRTDRAAARKAPSNTDVSRPATDQLLKGRLTSRAAKPRQPGPSATRKRR